MSITDTEPLPVLATYNRVPSALSANALGAEPTAISRENTLELASMRCPVAVLITDTELLPVLATNILPSDVTTIADGRRPTGIGAVVSSLAGEMYT